MPKHYMGRVLRVLVQEKTDTKLHGKYLHSEVFLETEISYF